MRILITGISGFVGTALIKYLSNRNELEIFTTSRSSRHFHVGKHYQIDLRDTESVAFLIRETQPDTIVHLAGDSSGRPNLKYPNKALSDNILGTNNLALFTRPNTHFIYSSSIVVYGDCNKEWMDEESRTNPKSVYAISKLAGEHLIESHALSNSFNYTHLRFSAIIGPNPTHGVVYELMKKLKSDSPYLDVIGTKPGPSKPYLYIDDAISAIELAINEKIYGAYNVCPDDNITIQEVVEAIYQGTNLYKETRWDNNNWKTDNKALKINNSKLSKKGWTTNFLSKEAIIESVK